MPNHIPRPNFVKDSETLSKIWPGKKEKEEKQAQQITQQQPPTGPEAKQTPSIYQTSMQNRARVQFEENILEREETSATPPVKLKQKQKQTVLPGEGIFSSSTQQQQQVSEEEIDEIFTSGWKELNNLPTSSFVSTVESALDEGIEKIAKQVDNRTERLVQMVQGSVVVLDRIHEGNQQLIRAVSEMSHQTQQQLQQTQQQLQQTQQQIEGAEKLKETAEQTTETMRKTLELLKKKFPTKEPKDDNNDASSSGNQQT